MLNKETLVKGIALGLLFLFLSPITHAAEFTLQKDISKKSVENNGQGNITKTKEIIASGYGVSEDKALKNAFKSAIQQFVGVVVDSETQMKNGKLIKDNILTASSGFIQKYDKLSTNNEDGLFEVKIKALVKSQKIFETIKSLNIATIPFANAKDVQARVETKAISKQEAGTLLKNKFDKLFSNNELKKIIFIKIDNAKVMEDQERGGMVPIKITYTIGIDDKIYSKKIQQLEQLFDNLGAKSQKRIDLPTLDISAMDRANGRSEAKLKPKKFDALSALKNYQFFIVKKYGQGYKTDVWTFANNYDDLPPFTVKRPKEKNFADRFNLMLEIGNKNEIIVAKDITDSFYRGGKYIGILSVHLHDRDGKGYHNRFYTNSYGLGEGDSCTQGLAPLFTNNNGMGYAFSSKTITLTSKIPVSKIGEIKVIRITLE